MGQGAKIGKETVKDRLSICRRREVVLGEKCDEDAGGKEEHGRGEEVHPPSEEVRDHSPEKRSERRAEEYGHLEKTETIPDLFRRGQGGNHDRCGGHGAREAPLE